jgi:hypothetical protein
MPPTVQQRRGTLAALTAANEILSAGQIVFESDTNKLKVGDGTTAYNSLPYIVGGAGGGSGGSALNRTLNALTFNGSTATFSLVIGSTAVTPSTAASLLILLNGVVQRPDVAYTVSGSEITFSVAPATNDTFFGVYLAGSSATFNSPAQITANQNNYALSVGATHVRLSSDAARTITGFVAEAGSSATLHNVGSFAITIAHESASSVAANRVISPTGADLTIPVNSGVTITYDATTARWRATAVVRSTIEIWWAASADKTKLDSIATGATANATDAQLRDRATHTGQQAISTVNGLQTALDGKQPTGSYAAAVHQHTISAVDGLQLALDGKQVAGSYAATVHAHVIADTSGLQAALDSKQASGSYAQAVHNHGISAIIGLQAALDTKQAIGDYATLVNGKVPATQLPSYVDDVIEVDNASLLPTSGEEGKLYLTINNGKIYRWAGTQYVEIVASPGSTDAIAEGSTNLYFTNTRAVSAVQSLLDAKAATSHQHVIADTTGLQAALNSKQAAGSYAAAVHGHMISEVTGLEVQLSEKAANYHAHHAWDIVSGELAISRIPTGSDASSVCIGNDARLSNARTPLSHTHTVSQISATGSASSSTFLRGDGTWASVSGGGSSGPTVVALTFASTLATNAGAGDIFDVTLTGNVTLSNPTNPVDGKTLRWRIKQDGTGSRTVTLGNKFVIPSSATSPLPFSTAANKLDVLAATYHAGRDKWDIIAFVPGY